MPDLFCLFPAVVPSRFAIPVPREKTARNKTANKHKASPEVAVSLKTPAGLTLSRGEVLQSTHDVSGVFMNGAQSYFARVEPGSSYVFDPIDLAVPASAETDLTITGGVYAIHHSIAYEPVSASPSFGASRSQSAVDVISYSAVVVSAKQVYDKAEEIVLTGSVRDSVSGYLLGNKPVSIMVLNKGFERFLNAVTASDGSFVSVSTPVAGEAGIYYISAFYPYAVSRLAQSSYSIVGLELGYSDYKATLAQNSSFTFDVPLINSGETAVDGLSVSFEAVSGTGVTMNASALPAEIEAGTRKSLSVTVSAAPGATSSAFTLKLREVHGFERTMPVTVSVVPAQVIPKLIPQLFEMGLLAGDTRTQSITVENIGFSTWNVVSISVPTLDWVKVQGPLELGDIAPGRNVTFTLVIQPPAGLSNGSYAQNPLIVLKSQNNADVPVNVGLVITAVKQGNAAFTAMNADKIPTDPSRWIGGADVTLTSQDIIGLSLKVKSDANGLARLENVPAGKYSYRAEASGFQPFSGMFFIEPGLTRNINVLMPTSMVTYKWSVTPTTIIDKYDITLDMTFRTDVPAPAIIIDPLVVNLQMEGGQTVYTQYTISNKGLVSVRNYKISIAGDDPAMIMEVPFTEIHEIKPGQSVVVPVKVTLIHATCHTKKATGNGDYTCAAQSTITLKADDFSVNAGNTCSGGGGAGGGGGGGGGGWGNWSVAGLWGTIPSLLPAPPAAGNCPPGDSDPDGPDGSPPYPNGGPPPECPGPDPVSGNGPEPGPGLPNSPRSLAVDYKNVYNSTKYGFSDLLTESITQQPDNAVMLTLDDGTKLYFTREVVGQIIAGSQRKPILGGFNAIPGYSGLLSGEGGAIDYLSEDVIGVSGNWQYYGKYYLTEKDGTVTEFAEVNKVWKPRLKRDRNNTTLTYDYNVAGQLVKVTDIHGRVTNFGYNAAGKLETVGDTNGRQLSYAYDGSGRLVKATDLDGAETTYGYDGAGFLSQVNYPNGAHKNTVTDSTGRVLSVTEDNGNNSQTFEYIDASTKTIVTDALGRQSMYEYTIWGGRKELSKTTDAGGNVTSYGYDGNFNKTSVTDALSRTTRMAYINDNLTSVTDPAGNTTQLTYEPMYNQVASVTDPGGRRTVMTYDGSGNLIKVNDAGNNISEMAYDRQGHVTGTKDPLNNVSLFEYDTMGALATVTDPLGRITRLTRDTLSRVTQTRDPKNKLTLFDYDIKGNLTKVTDAIGGITQYAYTGGCPSCGGGDLLASVKDAKNQQTTFAYDLQKRLTGVTNPLSQSKSFIYNKKGNLTSATDAKGQIISSEYDVLDRLTVKHLPNGEGNVTYAYDGVSNLLSVTSQDSAVSMAYGILNRVGQVQQTVGGQTYTISYVYDANGNRTQMTTPWGASNYTYDSLNRLTSITSPDAKTITFAYDALGRRTRMTLPNGTETTYAYDAAGQLLQILHRKTIDNTAILFANYAYDPAGNRASMQDISGTHSYGYDDLHRLISAQHPGLPNETFSYDAVGNRLSDAAITNYQHNAANRLLENSSYTYTYDNNGNLAGQTHKISGAYTAYAYTSENQLKQATMPGSIAATYEYDPLGRRIEKNVNGAITRYVYDNEDIIAILDGSNSLIATFTHGPGIDEPLIMKKADTSANYYYHADGLGSIISLTDSTGAIVETVEYQAYGKPIIKDHTGAVFDKSTVDNPYLFTAREYDHETGLFYYRARYYSPETGRFLQEDPYYNNFTHSPIDILSLEESVGRGKKPFTHNLLRVAKYPANFNYFAYALNNPILFTDPSGLAVCYRIAFGLPLYHCVSFTDEDVNGVYLLPNAKYLFLNFIDNNYLKSLPKYWPKSSCPSKGA